MRDCCSGIPKVSRFQIQYYNNEDRWNALRYSPTKYALNSLHASDSSLGTCEWITFTVPLLCVTKHYVFYIDITTTTSTTTTTSKYVNPSTIRPCDEIIPQWFDDYSDIPLHNMFADDSIWLTRLLSLLPFHNNDDC
jgi:hypothetical protein